MLSGPDLLTLSQFPKSGFAFLATGEKFGNGPYFRERGTITKVDMQSGNVTIETHGQVGFDDEHKNLIHEPKDGGKAPRTVTINANNLTLVSHTQEEVILESKP